MLVEKVILILWWSKILIFCWSKKCYQWRFTWLYCTPKTKKRIFFYQNIPFRPDIKFKLEFIWIQRVVNYQYINEKYEGNERISCSPICFKICISCRYIFYMATCLPKISVQFKLIFCLYSWENISFMYYRQLNRK